ncbi:Uncharacterised protein [uncultured archaeon]|nr:Uncharacterised protein [uncultured archaeon]
MAQPFLMDLISRLGLETNHFAPYTAANDSESLFDLTSDESGSKRHGKKLTTLELLTLGILRLLIASGGDMNNPNDPRHREWWATLVKFFVRCYHIPISGWIKQNIYLRMTNSLKTRWRGCHAES